jgi:hypothetical protein
MTVPAERMKSGHAHVVPLAPEPARLPQDATPKRDNAMENPEAITVAIAAGPGRHEEATRGRREAVITARPETLA